MKIDDDDLPRLRFMAETFRAVYRGDTEDIKKLSP